jgi:predicted PurR-regulated permease PerM
MPQACEDLATSGATRPPLLPIDPAQFQRRLTVATLGLLLVVLLGFVLYVCASILQPLFIAALLVYLILPLHQRLVSWRVAVSLPIVLSFLQFAEEPWKPLLITLLVLLVQRVVDNYLEPGLTGQKLGLSPLIVLLALAFWGRLWGVVGMILAVPLTVIGKIILENIRETKSLATLISNE